MNNVEGFPRRREYHSDVYEGLENSSLETASVANPFDSFLESQAEDTEEVALPEEISEKDSENEVSKIDIKEGSSGSDFLDIESIDESESTEEVIGVGFNGEGSEKWRTPAIEFEEIFEKNEVYQKKSKRVAISVISFVLAVIVTASAFFLYKFFFVIVPQAPQTAPESSDRVCEIFTENNLKCTSSWTHSNDVESGKIISQSLPEGEKVKRGTEVYLEYSLGPEKVTVPNFEGLTIKEARQLAEDTGLVVGGTEEKEVENLERGIVLSASIVPETTVDSGSLIDFVVSSGVYEVPDWIGKPSEVVAIEASDLGIDLTFLEKEDDGPVGIVLEQSLPQGEKTKNRNIEVTISKMVEVESFKIPDVIGLEPDDAQAILAEAGFTKLKIVEVPSSEEPGVFQTVPGVGQQTPASETIVIVVTIPESTE